MGNNSSPETQHAKVKYGLLCNMAQFQTHLIFHACQFHKDLIKTKWTMAWTSFSELKGKWL